MDGDNEESIRLNRHPPVSQNDSNPADRATRDCYSVAAVTQLAPTV